MISTEMNVDISNHQIVKDEPVCQEYMLTSDIKTKRVKQEPIDNIEIQKSDSQNESTSKKIKQEVEEEETTQTISIAFLNETTTTLSETTTNEKRNKLEKSTK